MIEPLYKKDSENPEEWFVEYCRKVKTNTIEIHKVLSSNDYLNWLVNFSNQVTSLSNENILANFTDEDKINVNRLKYLYEAIRLYADKSYIAPYEIEGSYIYYLKYQDFIFQIGEKISDTKSYSYTRLTNIPEDLIIINFNDIQEDKKLLQNDSLKVSLAELSKHIELLLANGVPKEEIIKTTNETINLKYTKKD